MCEIEYYDYRDICNQLARAITDLDVDIKVSDQNTKLKETYTQKLSTLEDNISLCNMVIEETKPLLNEAQEFLDKRRSESMQNINNALRISGEIIPDASDGIMMRLEGDEAWVSTPDGREVQDAEGGGFRQTSSMFLRKVMLQSNPELLQTMFLDEMFALISTENSATLSLYLNTVLKDTQVISIEQKPQVYSNVDGVMYQFYSSDPAMVRKLPLHDYQAPAGENEKKESDFYES